MPRRVISKRRRSRQPVPDPVQPVEPTDRVGVAIVLGGLASAVGWLVTPSTWLWLRLSWVASLVLASAWGSVRTWHRRRITIPGRYGVGGTVFTGVEAQLWAAVFGLMSSAIALGGVLQWLIDRLSEPHQGTRDPADLRLFRGGLLQRKLASDERASCARCA